MPDSPSRAVFLSYASQDAEAARRICETLRAAGVEVWFDADGGLEHGDEWDAKIRRQIKECVLFIPVISANTQARHEGYFRIEWELAAQRAMGIASGVPFILPVVIDDTREPDALVPDRFRMVQWTRLRGGEVPADVKQRFLKLWSHRIGVVKQDASVGARTASSASVNPAGGPPALPRQRRWLVPAVVAAAVAAAIVTLIFGGRFALPVSNLKPTAQNSKSAGPEAPMSEARKLAARANGMFEQYCNTTRAEHEVAEQLVKQALALDPNDAEIWAVQARLSANYLYEGYDDSPARRTALTEAADRAIRLAPDSVEARLAHAISYSLQDRAGRQEAERILRTLAKLQPTDKRVWRELGRIMRVHGKLDESLALYDRGIALGDLLSLQGKASTLTVLGRAADAEACHDAILAQRPNGTTYLFKILYLHLVHGNVPAAMEMVKRVPIEWQREDFGAGVIAYVWMSAREWDKALAALRLAPRDFLDSVGFILPKGYLIGQIHQHAGRAAAASAEWRVALKFVETRLSTNGSDPPLLKMKAGLLALLGEPAAAREALELYEQLTGRKGVAFTSQLDRVYLDLGMKDEVITYLTKVITGRPTGNWYVTRAGLRLLPMWDSLRGDPRFEALLVEPAGGNDAVAEGRSSRAAREPTDLASAKSVAVLPFTNQSADKDNEYFSDGIAEELLTVLQKIPGLRVAARTSAWSFKGKNPTAHEVGEKLGVAHVVEGSVQKSGSRVKITARLSRAATNEELWSRSFGPIELTDVFATQSEIAQAIVGELRGRLTGEAAAETSSAVQAEIKAQVKAATKGGTKNPEAHQLYLQGRFLATRSGSADVARGIDYYEQALKLDPSFAVAWAALARARLWQISWEPLNAERSQQAQIAAARALAIDADMADAHSAISQVKLRYAFEWRAAREAGARALALAPADAAILTDAAATEQALGSLEQSIELARRAVALDPVSVDTRFYLAMSCLFIGRLAEAEAETRRMIELSPNGIFSHGLLSNILLLQGRGDEALAAAKLEPEKMYRLQFLAAAHHTLGQKRESDAALAAMLTEFSQTGPYAIAWACIWRREFDQAFRWLDRAYQLHDSGISWLRGDTVLKPLHADPRWPAFLKKIGLSDQQLK